LDGPRRPFVEELMWKYGEERKCRINLNRATDMIIRGGELFSRARRAKRYGGRFDPRLERSGRFPPHHVPRMTITFPAEPYDCKNANFDSVEELLLVREITPDLFFGNECRRGRGDIPVVGLKDLFTVFSTATMWISQCSV